MRAVKIHSQNTSQRNNTPFSLEWLEFLIHLKKKMKAKISKTSKKFDSRVTWRICLRGRVCLHKITQLSRSINKN